MPMNSPSAAPIRNQLLARLPKADQDRFFPLLQPVQLEFKQVLYQVRSPIDSVYFPTRGTASALTILADGSAIEVATIGNEGMVGLMAILGAETSSNEVIVQIAGDALRLRREVLEKEAGPSSPLRQLLLLYHNAFLTQVSYCVACNGLHTVQQRCCRWLLMTRDRVESDEVPLTHEFLAIMLGVRRPSVTEVLHPLQEQGLIRNTRGTITIVDRKGLEALSCECYRCVRDEYTRLLG